MHAGIASSASMAGPETARPAQNAGYAAANTMSVRSSTFWRDVSIALLKMAAGRIAEAFLVPKGRTLGNDLAILDMGARL